MSVFAAFRTLGQALSALVVTEEVLKLVGDDEADQASAAVRTAQHEGEDGEMSENQEPRTLVEEIEVEGRQLVKRVQELIREGNVRRLIIKDNSGKFLLEVPLTIGVVAGGVFALASPVALALSALAGFVAKVKIEIVRDIETKGIGLDMNGQDDQENDSTED